MDTSGVQYGGIPQKYSIRLLNLSPSPMDFHVLVFEDCERSPNLSLDLIVGKIV